VLKSIKLPSPPQPPSAFLRLHAAKLNAYDIDDVLDSLRGALAQENVVCTKPQLELAFSLYVSVFVHTEREREIDPSIYPFIHG
jgi:hypothetical protein